MDLKKIRNKQNLTQAELAERCGVDRSTIAKIEQGANKPSVQLAKAIAAELGFNWVDFFEENKGA